MLVALATLVLLLQEPPLAVTPEELAGRHEKLLAALRDGIAVIDSGPLSKNPGEDSNTAVLDFKYLTNYHEDDGVLILLPRRPLLFVSDVRAAATASGFKDVFAKDQLDATARKALAGVGKVYGKMRQVHYDAIKAAAPRAQFAQGLKEALVRQRMVKSPLELKLIRKASDATNKAHLAILKAVKPRVNEGDIQKLIEDTFKKEGCPDLGFLTIVGSGANGTILHYRENKVEMPENTLVVCDIGAAINNYVTDITRTLPTSGKFTPDQRYAYQCVLDAQRAAERLLKPGATWQQLDQAAMRVFRDRQLTDWSYGSAPDQSVLHGLGHQVGMHVHDSDNGRPFEAGMVVTIEPGYYNKKKGWGIRIEDIYVVTRTGFERLSTTPREVTEIEAAMGR